MSYYPTLEELLSQDSEVLLEIKPSPRSLIGLLSRSIGAFLLASLIVWSLRSYTFRISPLWLYLVPIALSAEALRRHHDDLYVLMSDKIIHKGGRLSLSYSVPSIDYLDLRSVAVSQSFTGRLLDFGNIELNTAALDLGELFIDGVRAPDELADLIEQLRKYRNKQSGTPRGASGGNED